MSEKNLHEGHRQRLKNRFLNSGFDTFEAHNILELLLFYSIPRQDTNEIAHRLLNHFGCLRGVFDADPEELMRVSGVKENSATLIKMIPAIAREYLSDTHMQDNILDTPEKLGDFFVNKFFGETREIVYIALLNNNFELLTATKIHEGTVNSAQISPRKIMDLVVKYNASMLVMAHNHPNGNVCPSMEDINTTESLMRSFQKFDVPMVEHFVIAGNEYYPIIHTSKSLKFNNKENRDFFRRSLFVDEN